MRRITPEEKISIIEEVVKKGRSVYSVCKTYKISKPTFYKWLQRYKVGKKNRLVVLGSRVAGENSHYRSLNFRQKLAILRLVHRHPQHSCHKIAKTLGIGHHGVQNLLTKAGLNRFEQRITFSQRPFWKRESANRRLAMMELYGQGWKVKDICRHFNISKPTFIKWKKRFGQAKPTERLASLGDRFISGVGHHKYLGEEEQSRILGVVREHPQWSVHKIHANLAQVTGRPIAGHHGIQNLLQRENLNTFAKRLTFAQGFVPQPKVQVAPLYEMPPLPRLSAWRLLFAPFATVPKWVVKRPLTWPIVFPALAFLLYIFEVDKLARPQMLFPLIALTFGLIFFLYSLKYYISLILVMIMTQGANTAGEKTQTTEDKDKRSTADQKE